MYPLVGDADNGEAMPVLGGGGMGEISVSSPQTFNEPKTALKR